MNHHHKKGKLSMKSMKIVSQPSTAKLLCIFYVSINCTASAVPKRDNIILWMSSQEELGRRQCNPVLRYYSEFYLMAVQKT
jgi:hypothetical protein